MSMRPLPLHSDVRLREFIPDGIAVIAGLAVLEAQLLERLGEDVFAGHVGPSTGRIRRRRVETIKTSNGSTRATHHLQLTR